MSERTGLGIVEVCILEALDGVGGRPDRDHVLSAKVLKVVEDKIGLAPGYSYQVLADLTRRWMLPVPLVEPLGCFGTQDGDPPSPWDYTRARLSPAGHLALESERHRLAPVPIGLINGSTYQHGTRPPYRPAAVIGALRRVLADPGTSSKQIVDIIGSPDFLTGCTVTGDLAGLAAGRTAGLRLAARITTTSEAEASKQVSSETGRFLRPERNLTMLAIDRFPPFTRPFDVAKEIDERRTGRRRSSNFPHLDGWTQLPVKTHHDLSSDENYLIACAPEPGVAPQDLQRLLEAITGVTMTIQVALPQPLPQLIRNWISAHHHEDLTASLAAFDQAIASSES